MSKKIDQKIIQDAFNKMQMFQREADKLDGTGNKNDKFLDIWQERAYVRDKAKSANIDDEIVKAFFKESMKDGGMADNDINQILGWEFSGAEKGQPDQLTRQIPSDVTAATAQQRAQNRPIEPDLVVSYQPQQVAESHFGTTPSDELIKAMDDHVLVQLTSSDIIDTSNPDYAKIAENIGEALKDKVVMDKKYYRQLISEVKTVCNEMSKIKYDKAEDLIGKYEELKAKIVKEGDPFNDFRVRVLQRLFVIAEEHQKSKESMKVSDEYSALKKAGVPRKLAVELLQHPNWSKEKRTMKMVEAGLTFQKANELAESFPDFSGSFYKNGWGQSAAERFHLGGKRINHKQKGVISNFIDKNVKAEAKREVDDAYNSFKGSNVTDYRELKKRVEEYLKDPSKPGEWDKYTEAYLDGLLNLKSRFAFDRSESKDKRHEVVHYNKIEIAKRTPFTAQEFADKLEDPVVFSGLLASGLVTVRDDKDAQGNATYNLSKLSDLIRARVGADLRANKQKADFYPYDEVENIVKDIGSEMGFTISSNDAKNLIDMCGFEAEGRNWAKIALDTVVDTISDAFAAVGTAFMVAKSAKIVGDLLTTAAYGGNQGPYTVSFKYDKLISSHFDLIQNDTINFTFQSDGGKINLPVLLESALKNSNISMDNINIDMDTYRETGVLNFSINTSTTTPIDIMKHLQEELTREVSAEELGIDFNDINVTVDDKRKAEIERKKMCMAIFTGILTSLAINFLKNVLQDNQGELPLAVTQFENISLEKYARQIDLDKNMSDDEKEGFKLLAESFIERDEEGKVKTDAEGKPIWNSEAYKSFLNKWAAGDSSILSRPEFRLALDNYKNGLTVDGQTAYNKDTPTQPAPTEPKKEAPPTTAPIVPGVGTVKDEPVENAVVVVEPVPEVSEDIKPNYHSAHLHTWPGLAAMYDECKKHGHTEVQIIRAIKEANGIDINDNVIPQHLYLPEYLFGENDGKKKAMTEKEIFARDQKVKPSDKVISHGIKLSTKKVNGKFRGIKTWADGTVSTTGLCDNEAEALEKAKALKKPAKQ